MQQQNKKRYIVFDPDDSPEEMVLRINNEMTKTVEQLEAEEAELLAAIKANSIPDEYKELYAAEIAYVTKIYLQRYPQAKKDSARTIWDDPEADRRRCRAAHRPSRSCRAGSRGCHCAREINQRQRG